MMKSKWEVKRLGEVLEKTENVNPTLRPNTEFTYIDVSSVNNISFTIETTSALKGKDAPSRARKLVRQNDVIFATVRPTLHQIAMISKEYDNQVCSTGYFVLRGTEAIENRLIFYYLQTDYFLSNMEVMRKGFQKISPYYSGYSFDFFQAFASQDFGILLSLQLLTI